LQISEWLRLQLHQENNLMALGFDVPACTGTGPGAGLMLPQTP
jgi:hypothetical protein